MPDATHTKIQVGGPRAKKRGVALVDVVDAKAVGAYSWFMDGQGYAARVTPRGEGKRQYVLMHREILGLTPNDPDVDHIHGNRLDNRRENLRTCTSAQNQQNRLDGPYRGVSWDARRNLWLAQAKLDRKSHFLGRFVTQEEAAAASSAFRRKHMPYSSDARLDIASIHQPNV